MSLVDLRKTGDGGDGEGEEEEREGELGTCKGRAEPSRAIAGRVVVRAGTKTSAEERVEGVGRVGEEGEKRGVVWRGK